MVNDGHTLYGFVTPLANEAGAPEPPQVRRGLSADALTIVLSYIEDHLGDSIRLEELACTIGVSRFHFARLFRISTGASPMEFLLRARIERAKVLLRHSDRRLCEIAAALGFCDQSHFSRSFRRYAGMTPGQFIRQCIETNRGPVACMRAPRPGRVPETQHG